MDPLPYEIIEAMIQCFGRCFHYKDIVASFMLSAGIDQSLVDKYRGERKFVWGRHIIADLSRNEEDAHILRRLLTELCKLRDLPDPNVTDRNDGLNALRKLKELAYQHDLVVREVKKSGDERRGLHEKKIQIQEERAKKLEDLRLRFCDAVVGSNRQQAGYTLEDLLYDLFQLYEIDYKKPYRIGTLQQIDGHFNFEGFDYLVEARWRKDQPSVQEIGGFKQKVDNMLESTRGLFVAVQGIRTEVVKRFEGSGANIIFMDGIDLTYILEGKIDLREALKIKILKAAQYGIVHISLKDF
jgi:hypothetical protein